MLLAALPQVLLTVTIAGDGPVRFGVPLPARQLELGLRVVGGGERVAISWAPLHVRPDPRSDVVWVELGLDGAGGRVAIAAGGGTPGGEDAFEYELERESIPGGERRVRTWRWRRSGAVDRAVRTSCGRSDAEVGPGEWLSELPSSLVARSTRVRVEPGWWRRAGVLPPDRALGGTLRDELLAIVDALPRAPGPRGRGDYVRGRDADGAFTTVTNLEYDTPLGFARLALAAGSPELLARAYESAWHSLDHDLDVRTGLPYRHGRDHRVARPELGHVWLHGLLLVGCVFADRDLIDAALERARCIASESSAGPRAKRARDIGWPLGELEVALRFADLPSVCAAADRLAAELGDRWDPISGVFRFEEGEAGESYRERCWQTGGVVLPALRAHVARTGDRRLRECIARTERRLVGLVRQGRPGLPLSYSVRDGEVFGVGRREGSAAGALLLDGLSVDALRKVLARRSTARALRGTLSADDPDVATAFSMIARCTWVMR